MAALLRVMTRRASLLGGTDVPGTIERVTAGVSLTAENIWLLGCSAMLASIGLDVGSAAVIIGAMLISPLMGPILGVGLGLGIADRVLLQRSLRELALATLLTLGVSASYFLLSPLATPTAEMIARTRPTLLDVAVAFFGGVAGIVAGSRRRASLALPGAAIATALMPPLCTAGFGLATGNWSFLAGAFYLFALNAIFIGVATMLMVRLLRFPPHLRVGEEGRRRERRWVGAVLMIAIIPSVYFLYDTVRRVRADQRIGSFVEERIEGPGRSVPQWERGRHGEGDTVFVYVAGHPVDTALADSLRASLPAYGLPGVTLAFIQSDISAEDLQRVQTDVQRDILRAVAGAMAGRDSALLVRTREDSLRVVVALREATQAFPEIVEATYAPRADLLGTDSAATAPAMLLRFAGRTTAAQRRDLLARVEPLLRARLGMPRLQVRER